MKFNGYNLTKTATKIMLTWLALSNWHSYAYRKVVITNVVVQVHGVHVYALEIPSWLLIVGLS